MVKGDVWTAARAAKEEANANNANTVGCGGTSCGHWQWSDGNRNCRSNWAGIRSATAPAGAPAPGSRDR